MSYHFDPNTKLPENRNRLSDLDKLKLAVAKLPVCYACDERKFTDIAALVQHNASSVHQDDRSFCRICCNKIKDDDTLKIHREQIHGTADGKKKPADGKKKPADGKKGGKK